MNDIATLWNTSIKIIEAQQTILEKIWHCDDNGKPDENTQLQINNLMKWEWFSERVADLLPDDYFVREVSA